MPKAADTTSTRGENVVHVKFIPRPDPVAEAIREIPTEHLFIVAYNSLRLANAGDATTAMFINRLRATQLCIARLLDGFDQSVVRAAVTECVA